MTVWLAVLLPLAGAAVLTLGGGFLRPRAHGVVATAAIGASFAAFVSLLAAPVPGGTHLVLAPWLPLPGAAFSLVVDAFALPLALMVTGVSALIALYSIGYLAHDSGTRRYFAALDLFVVAMLLIVLADNLLLLFAGWELVGLCSYLLIGHWRERPAAAAAAVKAFVVNRVGDAAFLVGILAILAERGTVAFDGLGQLSILISALLLTGAIAKSAQVPLHLWLPDAMEGPTPVSALIHAATMVTAGVVLLLRLAGSLAPEVLGAASVIGAFTALVAALVALAQTDLKRVLAWSTISQIGLMFVGAGIGAAFAALFHLLAHALFKSTLFLGAGSVMHATDDELDVRRLGGLAGRLRWTTLAFAAGTLGLAAVPPAAGFFSKEAIAAAAADRPLLLAAVLLTSALSAVYAARLFTLVFLAPAASPQAAHAHESPRVMLLPLLLLASAALVFGALVFVGIVPLGVEDHHAAPLELLLASAAIAVAGAALGWWRYRGGAARELLPAPLLRAAASGFGFDATVSRAARRSAITMALGLEVAAERSLERVLDAVGALATAGSRLARRTQSGFLRTYEALLLVGAVLLLGWWTVGGGR